jgi:membrane protein YdbS with pleckstrin-like domain
LIALGVPLAWWYATMYVRHTGWALQPDVLLFRSGWLTRKLVVVPRDRIQTAHWHESPFDRRYAMASVSIDTAGAGPRAAPVRIPYLDKQIAIELAHTLYLSAAGEPSHSARDTERALT